jgi:hypothetical protein
MSTETSQPLNGIVQPTEPTDAKPVLATVVTKSLQFETTPLWKEYRAAAWAIQDTIERVAPEAKP